VSAEPPLSGTAVVGGGGPSVTVLVADDNDVALRLCRRVLEKAGYKVLTASDAQEAMSLALANSPDMILLDHAMPGMDSLEAMRQIKQQRPGIAIVIASVLATASDRERYLVSGADDVLIKPFRLSDLIAVVTRLTSIRSAEAPTSGRRKTMPEELRRTVGQSADIAVLTSQFPISTADGKPQFDFGKAAASVRGFQLALDETRRVLGEIARAYGALREHVPIEKLDVWSRVRLAPGTELNELPWTAFLAAKKSSSRLFALARSIALETDAASKEQRDWSWSGAERMFTTQERPAMYELSQCDWDELIQGKYIHELVDQSHALIDLVQRQLLWPPKPNRPADEIRRPGSAHEEHVYGAFRWCAVCGWIELMAAPIGVHTLIRTPSEASASQTTGARSEQNGGGLSVSTAGRDRPVYELAHDRSQVLEQKTLETVVRVTMGTAGLLTRTTAEGNQAVIMSLGLPAEVDAMEFQESQGIIGAVMVSLHATALADVSASSDLGSPPDLAAYGLQAAICAPMLEDGHLWGTISVFDVNKREWTADDQRVLATLANQAMAAVRNAELYDRNQRSIWELRNLQEALQAATSTLDLNQVLQQVLAGAAKASSAQIGCLALEDSGKLVLRGGFGTDSTTAERLALGFGGDICRDVMSTATPVMQSMEHEAGADSPLNPRAVLCVPITLRGKPQGLLFLANYQVGHVFTDDHRNLVTELAALAAVAIDRARLFRDREELILSSVEALNNAVDAAHPHMSDHSERVTQYAMMIARQMHYAPDDRTAWVRLERAGRLHDIGMISVPDAILQKAGPLTDDEFAKMKEHTVVGFNILSGLRMLSDELVVVRSHHERYDGKGYPDRKKGDELPMIAWIVSAADAFDAMTSDRPYRRGMPLEGAIEQVRTGAGTHFHPDVAQAVLDAAHNGTLKVVTHKSM
jgi:response regulator RpfG family c-di-GMP phosphodiesterase